MGRWAKIAPFGTRGADGTDADMPFLLMSLHKYVQIANERTFIVLQVEHQNSVDQAEALLAIEEVNFVMLGPEDFPILSGFPGDLNHPKVQAAIDTIADAA